MTLLSEAIASTRVAIVDIGSNSIKVLVAERRPDGRIATLLSKTLDARISAGISRQHPSLTAESMQRGIAAIGELLVSAAPFLPLRTMLVATSAVRDAENGAEFRNQIRMATGHEVRVLSGSEEANLIGRGLTCDPDLVGLSNFYVFDLGGGSLECLAFRQRDIAEAESLQLGCVRLTEKLVPDSSQVIPTETLGNIQLYTRTHLAASKFHFALPRDAPAVGTGGTITTIRAMLAARVGKSLQETNPRIELSIFRMMLKELSELSLVERKKVPGLPPGRADVFPTALATLIAIAEVGGFDAYQHSFYNLRYGLAAETLEIV